MVESGGSRRRDATVSSAASLEGFDIGAVHCQQLPI